MNRRATRRPYTILVLPDIIYQKQFRIHSPIGDNSAQTKNHPLRGGFLFVRTLARKAFGFSS